MGRNVRLLLLSIGISLFGAYTISFGQEPVAEVPEGAAFGGGDLVRARDLWHELYGTVKPDNKNMRDVMAAIYYFIPERTEPDKVLKKRMADDFEKKFGISVDEVGLPAKFEGYEIVAKSFLTQMIGSADDALQRAAELQQAQKSDTKAREIIEATYRLLYFALLGYEGYPTADIALIKEADSQLEQLQKSFNLDASSIRNEVHEAMESPETLYKEWHELMLQHHTSNFEPWCIPLVGYCIGSPTLLWTSLTTTAISALTGAMLLYKIYAPARQVIKQSGMTLRSNPKQTKFLRF